jgi:hypothetical protein
LIWDIDIDIDIDGAEEYMKEAILFVRQAEK